MLNCQSRSIHTLKFDNFMKMHVFYKILTVFYKKLFIVIYKRTQFLKIAFYKKLIFWEEYTPLGADLWYVGHSSQKLSPENNSACFFPCYTKNGLSLIVYGSLYHPSSGPNSQKPNICLGSRLLYLYSFKDKIIVFDNTPAHDESFNFIDPGCSLSRYS